MIRTLLHQLGLVVLLGSHCLDARFGHQAHARQFAAVSQCAIDPRDTARVAVAIPARDFSALPYC